MESITALLRKESNMSRNISHFRFAAMCCAAFAACWAMLGAQELGPPRSARRPVEPTVFDPAASKVEELRVAVSITTRGASAAGINSLFNKVPSTVNRDRIGDLITRGIRDAGWIPNPAGSGAIDAKINVRGKHDVSVGIDYTGTEYEIFYVSSRGMNYDPKKNRIHRKYYNWVKRLDSRIQQSLYSN